MCKSPLWGTRESVQYEDQDMCWSQTMFQPTKHIHSEEARPSICHTTVITFAYMLCPFWMEDQLCIIIIVLETSTWLEIIGWDKSQDDPWCRFFHPQWVGRPNPPEHPRGLGGFEFGGGVSLRRVPGLRGIRRTVTSGSMAKSHRWMTISGGQTSGMGIQRFVPVEMLPNLSVSLLGWCAKFVVNLPAFTKLACSNPRSSYKLVKVTFTSLVKIAINHLTSTNSHHVTHSSFSVQQLTSKTIFNQFICSIMVVDSCMAIESILRSNLILSRLSWLLLKVLLKVFNSHSTQAKKNTKVIRFNHILILIRCCLLLLLLFPAEPTKQNKN